MQSAVSLMGAAQAPSAHLTLPLGATVLDVTPNEGNYSVALAQMGHQIPAIDSSLAMRNQASTHSNVRTLAGVAEDIPLPSNAASQRDHRPHGAAVLESRKGVK